MVRQSPTPEIVLSSMVERESAEKLTRAKMFEHVVVGGGYVAAEQMGKCAPPSLPSSPQSFVADRFLGPQWTPHV